MDDDGGQSVRNSEKVAAQIELGGLGKRSGSGSSTGQNQEITDMHDHQENLATDRPMLTEQTENHDGQSFSDNVN